MNIESTRTSQYIFPIYLHIFFPSREYATILALNLICARVYTAATPPKQQVRNTHATDNQTPIIYIVKNYLTSWAARNPRDFLNMPCVVLYVSPYRNSFLAEYQSYWPFFQSLRITCHGVTKQSLTACLTIARSL